MPRSSSRPWWTISPPRTSTTSRRARLGSDGQHGVVRAALDPERIVICHRRYRPVRGDARIEPEGDRREEFVAQAGVLGEREEKGHRGAGGRGRVVAVGGLVELARDPDPMLPERTIDLCHPLEVPPEGLEVWLFNRGVALHTTEDVTLRVDGVEQHVADGRERRVVERVVRARRCSRCRRRETHARATEYTLEPSFRVVEVGDVVTRVVQHCRAKSPVVVLAGLRIARALWSRHIRSSLSPRRALRQAGQTAASCRSAAAMSSRSGNHAFSRFGA